MKRQELNELQRTLEANTTNIQVVNAQHEFTIGVISYIYENHTKTGEVKKPKPWNFIAYIKLGIFIFNLILRLRDKITHTTWRKTPRQSSLKGK